jgi:hypothetical protein
VSCLFAIALLGAGPAGAEQAETKAEAPAPAPAVAEAPAPAAYTAKDCINCHRMGSSESSLHISMDAFAASVHGQDLTCLDCHTNVKDESHEGDEAARVVNCNSCHDQENNHGEGAPADARPKCQSCHPAHSMLFKNDPRSAVNPANLSKTCAKCHPETAKKDNGFSAIATWQIASHKKGDFGCSYDTTNCIGCHQGKAVHGETAPINDQNCATCHLPKDGKSAMWGRIHPKADQTTQLGGFLVKSANVLGIALVLILVLAKVLDYVFDTIPNKLRKD